MPGAECTQDAIFCTDVVKLQLMIGILARLRQSGANMTLPVATVFII